MSACEKRPPLHSALDWACGDCGHTLWSHPGHHNPALTSCALCDAAPPWWCRNRVARGFVVANAMAAPISLIAWAVSG